MIVFCSHMRQFGLIELGKAWIKELSLVLRISLRKCSKANMRIVGNTMNTLSFYGDKLLN